MKASKKYMEFFILESADNYIPKWFALGTIILEHYSRRKTWFRELSTFEIKPIFFLSCYLQWTYFDFPEIIPTLQGPFNFEKVKAKHQGLIHSALPILVPFVFLSETICTHVEDSLRAVSNGFSLPRAATEKRKRGGVI